MADFKELPANTRVMAPLGDILHRGIVVEADADNPLTEGMICVEFTPPVETTGPYNSIDYISCPASSVTLGWF